MTRLLPAAAVTLAIAVTASAQDVDPEIALRARLLVGFPEEG